MAGKLGNSKDTFLIPQESFLISQVLIHPSQATFRKSRRKNFDHLNFKIDISSLNILGNLSLKVCCKFSRNFVHNWFIRKNKKLAYFGNWRGKKKLFSKKSDLNFKSGGGWFKCRVGNRGGLNLCADFFVVLVAARRQPPPRGLFSLHNRV